jgi:hypothetical protein
MLLLYGEVFGMILGIVVWLIGYSVDAICIISFWFFDMTWSTRLTIKNCGSKILLIGDVIFCSSIFDYTIFFEKYIPLFNRMMSFRSLLLFNFFVRMKIVNIMWKFFKNNIRSERSVSLIFLVIENVSLW